MSIQMIHLADNPLQCQCRKFINNWFGTLSNELILKAYAYENATYSKCLANSECANKLDYSKVVEFVEENQLRQLYGQCKMF